MRQGLLFGLESSRWTGMYWWVGLIAGVVLPLSAQNLQLISTPGPSQAPPAGAGGDSYAPIISPDGRYILFASTAANLLLTTNNNPIPTRVPAPLNVFLRDRTNGTTTLVSVNLSGTAGGNGDSLPAGVSTNGQYAVFQSAASDLVPGDTNNATDVFVRDLVVGTTRLVSVSTNGLAGNGASGSAAMTPDGRYVAFVSAANNLVAGDSNGIPDVFVRDLQANVTVLASVGAISTNAAAHAGGSDAPDIAPDGRYVAFYSTATNLVAGVPAGGDIYVRDLVSGTTAWASAGARSAVQSVFHQTSATSYNHALSADGTYVAYEASPPNASAGLILRYNLASGLTDLVHTNGALASGAYETVRSLDMTPDGRFIAFVANTNGSAGTTTCVLLWDAASGTATLVSGDPGNQVAANSTCDWPTLDPTGRYVAFLSSAPNLVTNPLAGTYHLYLRDTQAATTLLLDADTNGVGSLLSPATAPRLSADVRSVAFEAADGNLVANDRNHDSDLFVRDLTTGGIELISAREPTLSAVTPNGPSLLATTSVSTNGHLVAFAGEADNLVPNDTNRCRDIFVRDLALGTNLLISVATNGQSADALSSDPAISPDGRYVAFSSLADNLVAGDTNNAQDVFVRDLLAGTTTLVSVNTNGTGPGNNNSYAPILSAGGRYVLFRSLASNLAGGSSSSENLLLRDLLAGITYTLNPGGLLLSPVGPQMTPDGHYVGFVSNSVAGYPSLYVWDAQAATRIYTNSLTTASGRFTGLAISPDGRRLAFATSGASLLAADLVAKTNWVIETGTTNGYQQLRLSSDGRFLACTRTLGTNQVFLYDLQAGTNVLASRSYLAPAPANGASDSPDISPDGSLLAYRSAASDIVPGDANGLPDVFVFDRLTGATTLLSASRFGGASASNRSLRPVFSGDGLTLVFESWGSDLVAQDFNQSGDLFAFSLVPPGTVPAFQAAMLPGQPGPGAWLTWPGVPGASYRVQFKQSLSDLFWQDLDGAPMFLGNQAYFNDPVPGVSQRFYRIAAPQSLP